MMSFFGIIQFIWRHPLASRNRGLALWRFFSWQISQRIRPRPVTVPFVEDSVLVVEKGMSGATGNIYTGLLEFEDMAFILHSLRAGDIFADIGANVGAYTILAARNAGASVVSFEPIPSTFKKIQRNVEVNGVAGKVELMPYGVGDKAGKLSFTEAMDSINHVVSEQEAEKHATIEVQVRTLDELLEGKIPVIFKMDVEGFEWPALNGAKSLLASPTLKAIVIELNGSGARYGFRDEEIHLLLKSYGFAPYSYEPFSRQLRKQESYGSLNTIYVKDPESIGKRLREGKRYRILNSEI
jgi:FkbM family methyltransferase